MVKERNYLGVVLSSFWKILGLSFFVFPALVQGQVSLPNGTVDASAVDLKVKVLGGYVTIDRQWWEGQWRINLRWAPAEWSGAASGEGGCLSYPEVKIQGSTYTGNGQAWMYENRYSVRAIEHFSGSECLANRTKKLRWQDRNSGKWMEYERVDNSTLQFRLTRYGDRNDVTVNLVYNPAGQLTEVRDHFNKPVLQYLYSGDQLAAIRDVAEGSDSGGVRTVQYGWGRTNRGGKEVGVITQVTDVLGHITRYTINAGELEQIQDAEGRVRKYTYIADRVQTYSDGEGQSTRYDYDYDRLKKEFYVRITAPDGIKTEQWYDSKGVVIRRDVDGQTQYRRSAVDTLNRSETRSDAQGRNTVTTKDEYGNIIKTEYPDGSSTSAKYSALHGQITEETDELGIQTRYDYDSKGNLLKKTEAVGRPEQRITEYERDAYGQLTRSTLKGGNILLPDGSTYSQPEASQRQEYDSYGNLTVLTDPLGNVTRFSWNRQGQPLVRTDALGQRWSQEYDAAGHLLVSRNPLGQETRYTYDKVGNLLSRSDPLNNTWRFGYDKNNRLTHQTDPLNHTRSRQYDPSGRLLSETGPDGNVLYRLTYDSQGRPIESIDVAGNSTRIIWDETGGLAGPAGLETLGLTRRNTYDNRGRILTIQDSAQTLMEGKLLSTSGTTRNGWDGKGQLARTTDKNGNVTQLTYDGLGRTIQSTDPLGGITRYAWDSSDNLLAVSDATGSTTRYAYDAGNRRSRETRPLGQATTYTYDALDRLLTVTDPQGNQTAYRYDAAGRRVEETHTPAGSSSATRTIAYTWNAAGQLTSSTDHNAGHRDHLNYAAIYTLDALGRKTGETLTLGSATYTQATTWNANGQKASQTWPDGDTLTYAWDKGQLQRITFPDNTAISITERWWGLPKTTLYPGGSSETRNWDGYGRLIGQHLKGPGQSPLLQRSTAYDLENNPLRIDSEAGAHQYGYDQLYRLTGASHPSGLPTENYTYDGVGNRLTDRNKPNPAQSNGQWRYNANHQLLEAATENTSFLGNNSQPIRYTWDDNGSLIQKATPAGSEPSQPTHNQKYQYDAQNRLTETQDPTGKPIASYQYDPEGRRIRKTVHQTWNNGWQALPAPETHTYLYLDEGLSAEYFQQGNAPPEQQASYGWEPDDLWGTSPVWLKTVRKDTQATERYFQHNDHLGTPQKVSDGKGNIVWSMKATAFGETAVDANSVIENPLRFPGQYYDKETNTHYNFFRDYEPAVSRYIEEDPSGVVPYTNAMAKGYLSVGVINSLALLDILKNAGKINHFYLYAENNSINKIDIFGLAPSSICKGTDCVNPPYEPTPGGPKPSPQPRTPKNPFPKGKCHPLVEFLFDGCTCAHTSTYYAGCSACCKTLAGYLRSGGSACEFDCGEKYPEGVPPCGD